MTDNVLVWRGRQGRDVSKTARSINFMLPFSFARAILAYMTFRQCGWSLPDLAVAAVKIGEFPGALVLRRRVGAD